MAKLLYKELKCECGSPINHKDPKSGICVACGTVMIIYRFLGPLF